MLQFWSTSIACVLVQAVGLFYLKESTPVSLDDCVYKSHRIIYIAYAPVLLERKAKQIRDGMRDAEKGPQQEVRTIFDSPDREYVFFPLA